MLDRFRGVSAFASLSTLLPSILMAESLPPLDRIAGKPFIAKINLPQPTTQTDCEEAFPATNRAKCNTAAVARTAEGGNANGGGIATVKVDYVLSDSDEARLGDALFTAYKTAGHSKGAATWSWTTADSGNTYKILNFGSQEVVTKPVYNAAYPNIANDQRQKFQRLPSFSPDQWSEHTCRFDRMPKYTAPKKGCSTFVDPAGHRALISARAQEFVDQWRAQELR